MKVTRLPYPNFEVGLSAPRGSQTADGERLAPSPATEVQRKLAALVAADVVGYSRLMGRDEEGAVLRLRELQAAISHSVEAAGGRIANTAGDAMLLEFSSTVVALNCALAI